MFGGGLRRWLTEVDGKIAAAALDTINRDALGPVCSRQWWNPLEHFGGGRERERERVVEAAP